MEAKRKVGRPSVYDHRRDVDHPLLHMRYAPLSLMAGARCQSGLSTSLQIDVVVCLILISKPKLSLYLIVPQALLPIFTCSIPQHTSQTHTFLMHTDATSPHSNHVTSSKRAETLICHTTIHSINFLYNPGHVTLWFLEVGPVSNAREVTSQTKLPNQVS